MPLKAPPPELSASRRAIEHAFKDLELTISPAEFRDFASTTLEDVRRAALDLERQLAARQSLRNLRRLEPLFQGLHHYSKVVEVLCNGTPFLPWIWAPIKFILNIASDCTEAFDRIIKAYSQIAESLGRFQRLEQAFKGKPQLYPVFAIFYADILRFHKAAYRFLTRRCWKVLFMATWGRFEREFKTILEDLKQHQELIDKEVNAHDIVEAREMREILKSWRAESLDQLAEDQKQLTARQLQGVITWLRLDESDQIVLFDSLTKIGEEHPGTVDWILKKPQMASWLRPTPDTPFLCLQGAPGIGKSIIIARLVSFLSVSKSSIVIRHFCSYTHDSSTHYDQVIKSLLVQFAQHSPDLVAHIYQEYVGSRQATVHALEELLEMAVDILSGNGQRGIHILLDGLDECPIDKQRRLLRLLARLTTTGSNCKVMVSSRDTSQLPPKLRQSVFSLAEEKTCLRDAIATYARQRLLDVAMRGRLREFHISEDDTESISSHIGERADGMFLWATLVLNYLSANLFYTRDEFMDAIDTLPRELAAFYEKLLSHTLSNLDTRSALRLKAMFGWIAFAKRPLRKAELQSALMFQSDEPLGAWPVPAHILDACKPLVEERRDSSLAFIHISVRDYLQSDGCRMSIRMEKHSIRCDHALALLRCVREAFEVFTPRFPPNNRQLQVIRGVWGFLPFATEFWAVELQELTAAPTQDWHLRLGGVAAELSAVLETSPDTTFSGLPTQELEVIRSYFPGLWYDVALSLQARGSGQHRVAAPDSRGNFVHPTRVHRIFENYEATVRHVVEAQDHSDATPSEFQLFCANFSGHAYLCRFVSCVYAITGFSSEAERAKHESGHRLSFPCPEQGCHYPPFGSYKALRRHASQTHENDLRKRPAVRPISRALSPASGNPHSRGMGTQPPAHDLTGQDLDLSRYSLVQSLGGLYPAIMSVPQAEPPAATSSFIGPASNASAFTQHLLPRPNTASPHDKLRRPPAPLPTYESTPSKAKAAASTINPLPSMVDFPSAVDTTEQQRPRWMDIVTSQQHAADETSTTKKPELNFNDDPSPPAATTDETAASSSELDDDEYTSTDSLTDSQLQPNDWRLRQVKTYSFATNPDVTQYWHWELRNNTFIEHQVLESVKPIRWSVFKKPFNFHLQLGNIHRVLFARSSTLVLVVHKKGRAGQDIGPRGNMMAQFKRDRVKRRFLSALRQVWEVNAIEVEKEFLEAQWRELGRETLPGPDSDSSSDTRDGTGKRRLREPNGGSEHHWG